VFDLDHLYVVCFGEGEPWPVTVGIPAFLRNIWRRLDGYNKLAAVEKFTDPSDFIMTGNAGI
jgi:hypothetical protein